MAIRINSYNSSSTFNKFNMPLLFVKFQLEIEHKQSMFVKNKKKISLTLNKGF